MSEKIGDMLYTVSFDVACNEKSPGWEADYGTAEDVWPATLSIETWRVRSIQRLRMQRGRYTEAYRLSPSRHKYVFAQRFEHGHSVKFKTKRGKMVSFEWAKNPQNHDRKQWLLDGRPDKYRPTKVGALRVAIASIKNRYDYAEEKLQYELLRKRMLKMIDKLKAEGLSR